MAALAACFNDNSWAIRDAAITASSAVLSAFPAELSHKNFEEACFLRLSDAMYNVRLNAAKSLCALLVLTPQPKELLTKFDVHINQYILKAKE